MKRTTKKGKKKQQQNVSSLFSCKILWEREKKMNGHRAKGRIKRREWQNWEGREEWKKRKGIKGWGGRAVKKPRKTLVSCVRSIVANVCVCVTNWHGFCFHLL